MWNAAQRRQSAANRAVDPVELPADDALNLAQEDGLPEFLEAGVVEIVARLVVVIEAGVGYAVALEPRLDFAAMATNALQDTV